MPFIHSYYIDPARYLSGPDAPAYVAAVSVEAGATLGFAANHGVTIGDLTIGDGATLTASSRPYIANNLFKWRITGTLTLAQVATITSSIDQDIQIVSDTAAWAMTGGSVSALHGLRMEVPSMSLLGSARIDGRGDVELVMSTFSCSSDACTCAFVQQ